MLDDRYSTVCRWLWQSFQAWNLGRRRGVHFRYANPDIALDQFQGLMVVLDKGNTLCAAAQCLKPHGACAGKEIEHVSMLNMGADYVEQGFARPIRGRSDRLAVSRRGEEFSASGPAADDSHVLTGMMGNERMKSVFIVIARPAMGSCACDRAVKMMSERLFRYSRL